ncbi:hypothetical protein [Streptomyces sp. TLI_171]|uniref:hypothetical protein n=1 Tax=Streptomyces sp. TLI_171 TaxID=1938859 RepID=UPI000C3EC1F9|nr:hypothetical protein [Streptomyces sp. TLI_171]RKE22208.1 hypothetical protein BX266_5647 [Streptomyces sp. TLI_171]
MRGLLPEALAFGPETAGLVAEYRRTVLVPMTLVGPGRGWRPVGCCRRGRCGWTGN